MLWEPLPTKWAAGSVLFISSCQMVKTGGLSINSAADGTTPVVCGGIAIFEDSVLIGAPFGGGQEGSYLYRAGAGEIGPWQLTHESQDEATGLVGQLRSPVIMLVGLDSVSRSKW